MASGKIHVWFGLAVMAFSAACIYGLTKIPWQHLTWISIVIFIYSQLPDIDHRNSNITWLILLAGLILAWLGLLYPGLTTLGLAIQTLVVFSALLLKHRGPTHTIYFCLLSPLILLVIPVWPVNVWLVMAFAAFACYSHLLADGYLFKLSLSPKKGLWQSPPKNLNNSTP